MDIVEEPPIAEQKLGSGFYILNQGNYTAGNASLSYYSYESLQIKNNLFYQKNGIPLGDVAQSMTFWKHIAFIVLNNSGTIWAINASTGKLAGKISNLHSPRYVCVIDAEKSYVSDIYTPGIFVFQTSTMQPLGTIQTGKSTEQLVLFENNVFAANWSQYNQTASNNTIQVIDIGLDQLIDSIVVAKEPNSMVLDKDNKLWVLCSGGFMNDEIPALFRINPKTLVIEKRFDFPQIEMAPEQLTLNGTKDTLYYLNNGIFRMSIQDNDLPDTEFVEEGNRNYFALAIEPESSEVIVTDAGNYMQNGYVFRFRSDGIIIDSLKSGIIPGFIGFNK
ncbi:MAG: cell surface protein [Bacteroidetes bacterium HGW-Bacteroidetes-1]|jgi:hypothetical protein|nr:MAG: cell surface protein [Bacteroidetes bacterium HGW-Bacteroidetes-1]